METNNQNLNESLCDRCKKTYPGYNMISLDQGDNNYIDICFNCWNQECADKLGIPLSETGQNLINIADKNNKIHKFHILRHILANGIFIEAQEIQNEDIKGYKFGIRGDLYCDQIDLFVKLTEKIKQGLQKQYITLDEEGHKHFKDDIIVGDITWYDDTDDRLPLLIIDGKEYNWNDIGRMITAYEGFKIKLEIFDRSDDFE